MNESDRLVAALKRLLRKQGITYKGVADSLGISEPSVKRMFSRGTFTLDRWGTSPGSSG
jgi:DNA-binding transcriptional regulator LsrR (DeoR family)